MRGGLVVSPFPKTVDSREKCVKVFIFWNSWYDEPTDAGALGTEKCVLFAPLS